MFWLYHSISLVSYQGIRCSRVVSVGDFETGCPGFDPQSRHYGHGGVPLGKAHFLAYYWFVYPGSMNK